MCDAKNYDATQASRQYAGEAIAQRIPLLTEQLMRKRDRLRMVEGGLASLCMQLHIGIGVPTTLQPPSRASYGETTPVGPNTQIAQDIDKSINTISAYARVLEQEVTR